MSEQVMMTYQCDHNTYCELFINKVAALRKFDEIKEYAKDVQFYAVVCELELDLKEKE